MENKEKINSISSYLKEIFGIKTVKLSIDGGFTCPNRDGKAGFGGCSFCSASGSGDMASNLDNIHEQIVLLEDKWPKVSKFLAYFQSHTSTYAPVTELKVKYEKALSHEKIAGLVIATRPDCLPEDVLELLSELNKKTFLWVELGLQTIHEVTAEATNRGYPLQMYAQAVKHLDERKIKYVTHLILGLPGETREMMDASVKYVCGLSNERILNSLSVDMPAVFKKHPEEIVRHAVKGMMPTGKLGRQMFKKLKVYAGPQHGHAAQKPENLDV